MYVITLAHTLKHYVNQFKYCFICVSFFLVKLQSLYMAIVVYGPAIALEAGKLCSVVCEVFIHL